MQTKIVIRDFETTENLQVYLQTKIEDCILPFLKQYPKSEVQVKVEEDRHRSINRKPHFKCSVLLKITSSKPLIQIERSGDHFYTCVEEVCQTLKDVLRRKHRRLASLQSRRKLTITEIPYSEIADLDE